MRHADEESVERLRRTGLTRRDVLTFGFGLGAGFLALYLALEAADDPESGRTITNFADATTALDAGPVAPIAAATAGGAPWYPPDPNSRLAVVSFDRTDRALAEMYLERPGGPDYAVQGDQALVALILRDPHLGCRNIFCTSSQWWENPCHGEHYNRIGEHQSGPSPRGLDRYPTTIEDGRLLINIGRTVMGPLPGDGALDQPPSGPHCIGPD